MRFNLTIDINEEEFGKLEKLARDRKTSITEVVTSLVKGALLPHKAYPKESSELTIEL